MIATITAPAINWAALSPLLGLIGGALVVLLVGLFRSQAIRVWLTPILTIVSLLATIGLTIWQYDQDTAIISAALRIDNLTLFLTLIFCIAGIATVLISLNEIALRQAGRGEYFSLLLASIAGMFVLVGSQNLVSFFLGLELLSIPLYVLCASQVLRATSLESGLKYLIIGSIGSATFLYGLALMYGATASTDFSRIALVVKTAAINTDPMLLTGVALAIVGLGFKASAAPFHQWTPDVYEGAPTPITAFMAVATKAAALGAILRLFEQALPAVRGDWAPAFAAIATITIIVGNVGALGQSSLKRMMAYSGVAQAGYMLAGVVVGTKLGLQATVFYLFVYLLMNLAAFAVIIAREQEGQLGDDISSLYGIGHSRPLLAWPMTIAMLGLAGIPATAGFVGKIYLIQASVDGNYTWLAIMIVIGSMISLGYYLRVISAMWMRETPALQAANRSRIAGGSPELDQVNPKRAEFGLTFSALIFGAATLFFGIIPSPLFDLVVKVGKFVFGGGIFPST